ncbi:hypothetical protein EJ05DRAFT_536951 [Pseudovirgaria hyperparasitica]|uniref:DUF1275 domain protein n=1 Tax=Pseudovirgaria hyperparasitica TaxID=470096 RepID=A0A6A6WBZ5_9PEZI|nr:uncharacterized protein EJ05DRAFT_536951 [Pseudovirgaria hyperparasitica]KAF2759689.1 hypothetical protein EJ05DRAFT_536951 [Pseudovirgaria hyperparasitica]
MNGTSHPRDSEEGLLGRKDSRFSWANIRRHFDEDVTEAWGDALLIVTCFVTGLLDGAVFNVWSCFVSMMTGNTVYVGLGVTGQPASQPYRWAKSGTAILSFMLGTYLFSRCMRYLGPLRRLTVILALLLQALLCFASALLCLFSVVPADAGTLLPNNFIVLLPLCLLSIQSSGQIVLSRFLGYGEITTVVLTSAYCDLVFDEKVFTAPMTANVKRNRRVCAAVMLVLGAMLGGFVTKNGDITNALWISGAMKVGMAGVYVLWKGKGGVRLE